MNQRLQSLLAGLRGRRVLVTGASGRIGKRLVEVLTSGDLIVRGLYRKPPPVLPKGMMACKGDLLLPVSLAQAMREVDLVFHLASYTPAADDLRPEEHPAHWRVGVEGTLNLLQAAQHASVERFIFASSTRVIDGSDSLYARSKKEAETLVLSESGRLETVILRPAPVYGFAHQGTVAQMLAAVDKGRFPPIPDFGDRRSLVHVDDVIQALLLSAMSNKGLGETFTVTDCRIYSSREIYELILKALGRKASSLAIPASFMSLAANAGELLQWVLKRPMPLNRDRLARLRTSAWFDAEPLVQTMDYLPWYDLEKALPEIVENYRQARVRA